MTIDDLDNACRFRVRLHILDCQDQRGDCKILLEHCGLNDRADVTDVGLCVISIVDRREYADAVDGDGDRDLGREGFYLDLVRQVGGEDECGDCGVNDCGHIFFACKYTIGRRAGKRHLICLAMWGKFATFAGSKMDINGSKSKIYSKRRKGV